MKKPPRDVMDSFPDRAQITPFDNENFYGLTIHWSVHGTGFGELAFYVNKKTGELGIDKEAMGDAFCARIMRLLRDQGTLAKETKFVDVTPDLAVAEVAMTKDRQTMRAIMQVLGPEPVCECAGCAYEQGEALRLLREAGIEYISRKGKKPGPRHNKAKERKGNGIGK